MLSRLHKLHRTMLSLISTVLLLFISSSKVMCINYCLELDKRLSCKSGECIDTRYEYIDVQGLFVVRRGLGGGSLKK